MRFVHNVDTCLSNLGPLLPYFLLHRKSIFDPEMEKKSIFDPKTENIAICRINRSKSMFCTGNRFSTPKSKKIDFWPKSNIPCCSTSVVSHLYPAVHHCGGLPDVHSLQNAAQLRPCWSQPTFIVATSLLSGMVLERTKRWKMPPAFEMCIFPAVDSMRRTIQTDSD